MHQQQLRVVSIVPSVSCAVHTSLKITFLFFSPSFYVVFVSVIQFIFILPTICYV